MKSFEQKSRATIMTDLSYGDAGKGTTTEYLANNSSSAAVIRFNGGGQAEHNIVTPDGRHHTFSQFGAGSFLPGVATHLSRDMLVNPINMNAEADHLAVLGVDDVWERTTVDEDARIVTPYHRAGNRLRELARNHGTGRHGSTGQGISEAVMDWMFRDDLTLHAGDITSTGLVDKLEAMRKYKRDQMTGFGSMLADNTPDWEALNDPTLSEWYAELYVEWAKKLRITAGDHLAQLALRYEHLIFEPAQGVLLDEKRGFHPHTTWSNTTPWNAEKQLEYIDYDGDVTKLGILRAYTTRHGYGPFVTEDEALDGPLSEYFNGKGPWQGKFRIGHFDAVAHRYAAKAAGRLDGLVVTGIDRVTELPEWKYATHYEKPSGDTEGYLVADPTGDIRDIVVGEYGDKEHLKQLTRLMFSAIPRYESIAYPTPEQVVGTIEREMGQRVVLASFGPTMNDKVVLDHSVMGGLVEAA